MTLKKYLARAKKEKFAIGQFNFSTAEQLRAIAQAAIKLKAPAILGVSRGEVSFIGLDQAVALVRAWREQSKRAQGAAAVFLNLDHAREPDVVWQAIELGFDAVQFDGATLPFEQNIKITRQLVELAHKKGIVLEAEIDKFGSEASQVYKAKFEVKRENLTEPGKAVRFVRATGADALAINIGSFHGVQAKGFNPRLDLKLLAELNRALPKTFLVLHGSSGALPDDLVQSIAGGIVKINVNTDLRLAFTNTLKTTIQKSQEIAPYKYLQPSVEAVQAVVEQKIRLFGSAGKA